MTGLLLISKAGGLHQPVLSGVLLGDHRVDRVLPGQQDGPMPWSRTAPRGRGAKPLRGRALESEAVRAGSARTRNGGTTGRGGLLGVCPDTWRFTGAWLR